MSWKIASLTGPSTKTLEEWRVIEVPFDGADVAWTRHVIGWRRDGAIGQVSSPVEVFDPQALRLVTRSGQIYQLDGPPGLNVAAYAAWNRWLRLNKIEGQWDVTDEVTLTPLS